MRRISSHWTVVYKWIFPLFALGFAGFFLYAALTDPESSELMLVLLVSLPLCAAWAWFYYKLIWVLADRVEIDGEQLVVRRRSTELRIPFSGMLNVGYAASTQPPRLSLRLRKAGVLGDEIQFVVRAAIRWDPFARNPVVEELIQKIDAARRSAA